MTENQDSGAEFDGRIGLLNILADIVNPSDDFEITITLNVQGTVVSGTMIPAKRYYEKIGILISEANKGSGSDEIKEAFDELAQAASKNDGKKFNFIYLKDAQFLIGKDFRLNQSSYWIGKIESVDGFTFGSHLLSYSSDST